LHRFFL